MQALFSVTIEARRRTEQVTCGLRSSCPQWRYLICSKYRGCTKVEI